MACMVLCGASSLHHFSSSSSLSSSVSPLTAPPVQIIFLFLPPPSSSRAGEKRAACVKAEKQNRELQAQLQETQDDLESEREIKLKVDHQSRQADEVSVAG